MPAPSLRTIWCALARTVQEDWRDAACRAAYNYAVKRAGTTGLGLLYDATTLYSEAGDEDNLRKVG
jgi:hypothetical protein